MSLSISDAHVFSAALKKARQKLKLTQAECAELLDHSLSFQKDLERRRCSPSIEGGTISAGHWICLQMTVFFKESLTELTLHIKYCYAYYTLFPSLSKMSLNHHNNILSFYFAQYL